MRYLFLLLLIFVQVFCADFKRDRASKVVIDLENKLMWIDNINVAKLKKTHEEATKYCDTLNYAGYNNWRIPEIEEYKLIVDKTNEINYINRAFRFNVPAGYWARRAHWRTLWFYADYMFFVSGTAYFDSRHKAKYVRCVRDIK